MSDAKPASRRRHDVERKRQVIAACAAPGASVALVAMSYGLNANLLHKWRRVAARDGEPAGSPAFVPVSVVTEAPPCEPLQPIELELQRGQSTYGFVADGGCRRRSTRLNPAARAVHQVQQAT